ncbi:MAG: oligoendopeptidase F [Clostridium argentinense]|uniref:Oligopeptidase F n=1 Tax=Clostridium faecium TaxID=2762223 RepID=A0ABR8YSX9_9CLOT|nr:MULTISPECIES: oligoendopeptidase F [Clostridium]MBD8047370.1 oligoendopeptidase F [Clostridium faecium]MBS5823552.1 oligoendopeptidase F [Clostridium argentinense]MDU1350453.1 oligoendopeptidase F [Clostridium argentinense]
MSEVKKLKTRDEIHEKYKWNVEKMYANEDAWESDFTKAKEIAPKLLEYKGKLKDPAMLLGYLENYVVVSNLIEDLYVYAHLRSDENTANTKYQVLLDRIRVYFTEVNSMTSFFIPELLTLSEDDINKAIDELEPLKLYEKYLKDILEQKPHVLSEKEEKLLASAENSLSAPGNIFNMLSNADMTFPVIKDENNNSVELTEGNYSIFIRSKDRRVRQEAFSGLFDTYKKFKNTLATAYTSSVKSFIFKSKARNYSSSLESSLKPNKIPLEVYKNVVDTINNNLSSLHRYVSLKKKLLKLDEMHMYDLYVPNIETPKFHIPYEEGIKICVEALKPMGEEYLNIFKEGIEERWIDVYENKGKRGGAYSSGSYNSMPYVLLNYSNQINDVSTLAHEMGHSIHSYYSKKNQPYIYADYVLFCAEVASITNECILMNHLIKEEQDKMKKLYLINEQLESIRTTVFRQTMFAEFELLVHEKMEAGEALSSDDLCSIYHDLNVKYFGKDMVVDSEIDMEWSRIPHFYRDFYVYQYVTGFAAANSFSQMIINGGAKEIEQFKGFLKAGCSDYPINILKNAGVDMTTPKPLEDTIKRFDMLLDMLEKEI